MNIRMTLNMLGRTVMCEAALLVLPIAVALIYGESILGLIAAMGIAAAVGGICMLIKPKSTAMYAREGFVVCGLSWILLSVIGAVPFVIEGFIPNYIDALFEMVSGFTTTGATVLTDFTNEGFRGLFFWRAFSHFIGGMGVLVFMLAVMPLASDSSIHLMRAEVPGPVVGKLVPKMKQTAIILYAIYVVITITEVVFLLFGGMSLYDALIHAFSTAGTGGFSNRAESLAYYSPYCQYVAAIFMLIFAVNFNLYYFILIKQWRSAVKNEELHWYLGIVFVFTALITVSTRLNVAEFNTTEKAFRASLFHVASMISSTGFLTADLTVFTQFAQAMFFVLMFIGACAGSTGGALKVSRVVILLKSFVNEFRRLIRPCEVTRVRMNNKPVADKVVRSIATVFGMYMFIIAVSMILVSLDGFPFTVNTSAVVSCMGNMGPGLWLGSCFVDFSWHSKTVLIFDMLLGRLEIIPILMLFVPDVWRFGKKSTKLSAA